MQRSLILVLTLVIGLAEGSLYAQAAGDYIGLYQRYLSRHKNSRCAMYPTCSAYGAQVFSERPFWEAMALTADRLSRCSHDPQWYTPTYRGGYRSYIDYPYYKEVPATLLRPAHTPVYAPVSRPRTERDSTLVFIHRLINRRHYNMALLRIEECLFAHTLSPDSVLYPQLLCYRALGRLEEGVFEYETSIADTSANNSRANLQAALMYKELHNYEDATRSLQRNFTPEQDSSMLHRSYTLQAILNARQERYKQAGELLTQAARYTSDGAILLPRNLAVLHSLQHQKQKSPVVAGLLSVIPGGGYLYTGHKGSALTSLAVNTLLAYATYTSIRAENYGLAGICGCLSLSFYIGNINGASRSAARYNRAKRQAWIEELEHINHLSIY